MRRYRHSECERSYRAYEPALMTFADEAASSPSQRSNVSLSRAQKGAPVSRTHDCPSEYDCPFYRRGRPAFQHKSYFVGRCLPKAVATSFLFMRAFGLPRSSKLLLFGAITHHAGMGDLGLLLGVMRGRDFIRHIKYSVRRVSRWGDAPFVRKTKVVRKVTTVQNCSMKGLPMRRALTTGVVRRSNICSPASSR